MGLVSWFKAIWQPKPVPTVKQIIQEAKAEAYKVDAGFLKLLDAYSVLPPRPNVRWEIPRLPANVAPQEAIKLAQDNAAESFNLLNEIPANRMGFLGYPYLAELTQIMEFRKISERTALELCRKWVTLKSRGDTDKTKQIEKINEWLEKFEVKDQFRQAAIFEGWFGRCQLYVDVNDAYSKPKELIKPLTLTPEKIRKGSVDAIRLIEPITSFPYEYNSRSPLAPNFYRPQSWYVMGDATHNSRLLMFNSRPVPVQHPGRRPLLPRLPPGARNHLTSLEHSTSIREP